MVKGLAPPKAEILAGAGRGQVITILILRIIRMSMILVRSILHTTTADRLTGRQEPLQQNDELSKSLVLVTTIVGIVVVHKFHSNSTCSSNSSGGSRRSRNRGSNMVVVVVVVVILRAGGGCASQQNRSILPVRANSLLTPLNCPKP